MHLHGWFLPNLEKMRDGGFIDSDEGTTVLDYTGGRRNAQYYYEGEVDLRGQACGVGAAIDTANR